MTLDVFIPGLPVPQGSARAFVRGKRAIVTSANANLRPWRLDMKTAIADALGLEPPAETPVAVTLAFVVPRPASHFGKRGLRGTAPEYPTVRPDLDKLARACLDALTEAAAIRDDAQVVELMATKDYGDRPGVRISMTELTA